MTILGWVLIIAGVWLLCAAMFAFGWAVARRIDRG